MSSKESGLQAVVGDTTESVAHTVSPAAVYAFALATSDDPDRYERGSLAPPVYAAVVSFPVVRDLLLSCGPLELLGASVHLAQFMRFHRHLRIGETLHARAEVARIRSTSFGAGVCFKVTIVDQGDGLVHESYHDVLMRGALGIPGGEEIPQPRLSRGRTTERLGETVFEIAADQSVRYGDASGDLHPIHRDVGFARSAGFPDLILHGMCTFAMCGQAVVRIAAGGDQERLRSLGATFTQPAIVGRALRMTVDRGPDDLVAVGVTQTGRPLTRHGVAEIEPGN